MGRVKTFFGLTFGVFVFMQSMETVHHWLALYLDEKALAQDFVIHKKFLVAYLFVVHKERLEREMEIKRHSEESDSRA